MPRLKNSEPFIKELVWFETKDSDGNIQTWLIQPEVADYIEKLEGNMSITEKPLSPNASMAEKENKLKNGTHGDI